MRSLFFILLLIIASVTYAMEDGFNEDNNNKEKTLFLPNLPLGVQKEIVDYAMPQIGLKWYRDSSSGERLFQLKAKKHRAAIHEINEKDGEDIMPDIMPDNNLIEVRKVSRYLQEEDVKNTERYFTSHTKYTETENRVYYESGNGRRWCFLVTDSVGASKALSASNSYFYYHIFFRTYQFMTRAGAILCDSQVGEEVKKTVATIEDYIFLLTLIYNKKALYLNKAGAERLKKFPKLESTFYRTSKSKNNDIWKLELQKTKKRKWIMNEN